MTGLRGRSTDLDILANGKGHVWICHGKPLCDTAPVCFRPVLADLPLALDDGDWNLDADDATELRPHVMFRCIVHRPGRGAPRFLMDGKLVVWVLSQSA